MKASVAQGHAARGGRRARRLRRAVRRLRARRGYRRPLLATSTDGVGTKVAIAQRMDVHDTIGIDLVGMVVDDLVVCGAEPLFMTDYIASARSSPSGSPRSSPGIAEGCRRAGCALVGGETAEHPGLLGARRVRRRRRRHRRRRGRRAARPGPGRAPATSLVAMALVGPALQRLLPGPARAARRRPGWDLDRHVAELGRTLGEELLEPTRIYALDCLALVAGRRGDVHAFAHVTGGGLAANLARVLPAGVRGPASTGRTWAPQPVFGLVGALGRVPAARAGADPQHGRRDGRRGGRRRRVDRAVALLARAGGTGVGRAARCWRRAGAAAPAKVELNGVDRA